MLNTHRLRIGDLETNCYLAWDVDTKEALIIDPADDGVFISEEIQRLGLNPKLILATHGHFDHVLAALDIKLIFGIPFGCSRKDEFLLKRQNKTAEHFLKKKVEVPNIEKIDFDLDQIELIKLGNSEIAVYKTPGHTPGGVCFYNQQSGILFSGDTIFLGQRGRTDLSYSSTKDIYVSIRKLMELPEETEIFPGHGEPTSIAREKPIYKFV